MNRYPNNYHSGIHRTHLHHRYYRNNRNTGRPFRFGIGLLIITLFFGLSAFQAVTFWLYVFITVIVVFAVKFTRENTQSNKINESRYNSVHYNHPNPTCNSLQKDTKYNSVSSFEKVKIYKNKIEKADVFDHPSKKTEKLNIPVKKTNQLNFCPLCGSELHIPKEVETFFYCPHCGTQIVSD